ncbi:sulfite exporter TauE/SafE family protein [Vibrio mexicanus]|uniref:sulfite exporter TauE/SafE family protein n=1 Tax=Vibrio mexicanus TaxID=1004326 RepID=UPI00063C4344|nr:sulfite exporter TauE/SafE family protein [Vibrio mexicanus]
MEWMLLFFAGVAGGVINSVAGGGSFITFPALMWVGVPPIAANATNTFAACAGYLSGSYGFRKEIAQHSDKLWHILIFSFIGGGLGAYLLLNTSEELFIEAIPWLLLFATVLFVFGQKINQSISAINGRLGIGNSAVGRGAAFVLSGLLLVSVSAYGGFFNAGLGIIVLSYLVLVGYTNINAMNGLKLLISSAVSLTAISIFVVNDSIDWPRGLAVLLGTLVGGYLAARVSRVLPQYVVRHFVTASSAAITLYFFYDVYWRPAAIV